MPLKHDIKAVVLLCCLTEIAGCSAPGDSKGKSQTPVAARTATPSGASATEGRSTREASVTPGNSLGNFEGKYPRPIRRHPLVQYDFQLKNEAFFLHVPENYDGNEPFGILAFIAPGDSMALPEGWDRVLKDHKLIYLAPQKAGNTYPVSRRAGLTLAGILKLTKMCKIDPNRIYVTGLSGGARVAVRLAFFHPELIGGALPCGGADFYETVPKVHAQQTDEYGAVSVDPLSILMTRMKVPFALITGTDDPRHGNLMDLYEGGFTKRNFRVKLFDVPNMGHGVCGADTLNEALRFVESPSIWNGTGAPEALRLLGLLAKAKDSSEVEAAAFEAWRSNVDPEIQSYAIAYARLTTNASRSAQMLELMMSALDDPVAEAKKCRQLRQGNGLMRKRAEEHLELLLANPRIKDRVSAACDGKP
jgi:dienelactone hydrolase